MSYAKNTNVTKNSPGYIKSYVKNRFNVTAGALCMTGKINTVTLVTLKLTKHFVNTLRPMYTTIYNNNIKLYIFNVTDVTALVALTTTTFLGYITNVTLT